MTFRVGQQVRAVKPDWAKGFPMIILGAAHPLGHVPPDSLYHGMDPEMLIQAVDAPCSPEKPGYYCAWPVAWLEADDGNESIAWTEHLRKLCDCQQTEDA